jgi:hypothetical protein
MPPWGKIISELLLGGSGNLQLFFHNQPHIFLNGFYKSTTFVAQNELMPILFAC